MIIETSIIDNGNSIYVRIPNNFVQYYGIRNQERPFKCKIEDINDNEAKITFTKW